MDTPAPNIPKKHLTATISPEVFKALEDYREQNKESMLPDRSSIIEAALVMYLESKGKPKSL